uniref:LamG-like jellyroll fold domain-containing protein n=1 Tax=Micromonas commoda virus TaxID=3057169 RepID=A0AAU7YNJ1_9PHYC
MSINNLNTYLNVRDAHLRVVSGNVYAQAMNIGGINVETAHGLQSVSNTGNATSLTLEFANVTTGFVTTANAQIGRDLVVTGNATVSTDLTVSANATVTDTLTVSEHLLASKEATVTGNLHVTTIMSDSNVVAEYTGPHDRPLRKYPEVNFLGDGDLTQFGYTASSSGQFSATYPASNAFTGTATTTQNAWVSLMSTFETTQTNNGSIANSSNVFTGAPSGEQNGPWLKIELPKAIKLSHSKIYRWHASAYNTRLKDGYIYGSNDDSTYTRLVRLNNLGTSWDQYTGATINVNATEHYKYYVLHVREIYQTDNTSAANSPYVTLGEWELYGYEEGSGSLDTTLKSVYNVPATTGTQLEVYYDAKDLADGAVTNVNDLSPNSNGGSPTSVNVSDGAFVFNGTSSLLEKTSLSIPGGDNPLTFSFWVKNDDFDNTQYIFRLGDNTTTYQTIALYKNTSSQFVFATWALDFPINYTFTSNQWNHVSLVYPGGGWKQSNLIAYVDGKPYTFGGNVSVGGVGGTVMSLATSLTLRLGGFSSGNTHFDGSIANFRLYSKALNADQVKELYEYQKDYFLGSKSQVTLYKGHLGVGVTEPSGQLELAGDERLQEYPPRAMTHSDGTAPDAQVGGKSKNITYIEGHGEFKASASKWSTGTSGYDGQQPYNAFDKTTTRGWLSYENVGYNNTTGSYEDNEYILSASSGTPYGHWLKLEMPYTINIKGYFLDGSSANYSPHDWQIWASNDDTNWTHIHSYSGETYDASNGRYYTVSHTGHYKMFAIIVTSIHPGATHNGSPTDRIWIREMKYFGTPGPTTLDKGSLSLTRSLDVPRISRYDVDTETPRPEKLVVDFDTTVNSSPTDISGKGKHGAFYNGASYSPADKAFSFDGSAGCKVEGKTTFAGGTVAHSLSCWFKVGTSISGTTNAGTILSLGTYSSTPPGSQISALYVYDDRLGVYHWNNDILTEVGSFDVDDKSWHMMTYVHLGGAATVANQRIYLDGVSLPLTTTGATHTGGNLVIPANANFTVGATSQTNSNMFTGLVSNPKLYNVALEPSEVRKLYNLGRTGRSMVISDTAVGIGKVPEAQLDIRGNLKLNGLVMPHIVAGSWGMTGANPSTVAVYMNEGNCVKSISNQNTAGQGNGISGNRGQFTAPVTGLYNISFNFVSGTRNSSNYLGSYSASGGAILTSPMGSYREMFDMRSTDNVQESYAYTMCAKMDAGDIVKFSTYSSSYVDSGALIVGSVYLIYAIPSATW